MSGINIVHLRQWIGRMESRLQVIDQTPAASLAAMLDRDEIPDFGDPLPALWHWIYFTPAPRQSELGEDGHPRLGGFMPPVPLPRRMWAGGRLRMLGDVRIGEPIQKETTITDVVHRHGKQGDLVFVTLRHRLSASGTLMIEEEQDIVYRNPPSVIVAPAQPVDPVPVPRDAVWRDPVHPTPALLFRYSALTFNAHRIHYDLRYATGIEGYRDLVVHGPLVATLLAEQVARRAGACSLSTFSFRAQQPLLCGETLTLCGINDGSAVELWAEGPQGRTAFSAQATLR